jgi:SAM-dependent methyltransferase
MPYCARRMTTSAMSPDAPTTQAYYDRFAAGYETERHHGYHRLIDELELELVRKYGEGRDVFEAGCGTGLLLREAVTFARSAVGLDLSRGMLRPARDRGLRVVQGSLTDVPLPSSSVDLVYSMKVLAHVAPIERAVAELARVVRPGGHLLLEFYNPWSLRTLAKRVGGPGPIAAGTTEADVFTRYDTLARARTYLPPELEVVGVRGVRVVTPTSKVFALAPLGRLFSWAERAACDAPLLRHLGGFLIVIARKRAGGGVQRAT